MQLPYVVSLLIQCKIPNIMTIPQKQRVNAWALDITIPIRSADIARELPYIQDQRSKKLPYQEIFRTATCGNTAHRHMPRASYILLRTAVHLSFSGVDISLLFVSPHGD